MTILIGYTCISFFVKKIYYQSVLSLFNYVIASNVLSKIYPTTYNIFCFNLIEPFVIAISL